MLEDMGTTPLFLAAAANQYLDTTVSKFLQNDISSFLDPNEVQHQGQLFEFGNEMIEIAQQIVQSSCDLTAN